MLRLEQYYGLQISATSRRQSCGIQKVRKAAVGVAE
jgi:hypothetical protein